MVRELRRIGSQGAIAVATSQECQFTDLSNVSIDFKKSGNNLLRNSDILTTYLASLGGLSFFYFNNNIVTTTDMTTLRYVKVRLVLVKGTQMLTIEDGARIRNL